MAAPFYNQTVSPLLLFHVNRASEHNVISRDEKERQLAIEL